MARLHYFPTPYPGESMYSVMSRYHQRSYNRNKKESTAQLLPSGSMTPHLYIISPVHRKDINTWFPDNPGNEILYLHWRDEHSAFPLLCHLFDDSERFEKGKPQYSEVQIRRTLSWGVYHRLGNRNTSSEMKYCPHCAAEEFHRYGECYWHVLHQISGMYICPIHKTLYAKTQISIDNIRFAFYPLSEVIDPSRDNLVCLPKNLPSTVDMYDYSQSVYWMLKNPKTINKEPLFDKEEYYRKKHIIANVLVLRLQ